MKIDDICPRKETMLRHPKGDPALVPSRRLYIGSWAESRPASPDGHTAEAVVS